MIMLLKNLISIKQTGKIRADKLWGNDIIAFLLFRSNACILQATLQNLGLTQHPKDILLHNVVVLDLSYNCIDCISRELLRLTALKSLNLSHNIIKAFDLDEVSFELPLPL